ncbi:putative urease accessory protein [Catenulispora acidiphila DSM 44928]|uniref:Urease accessory protein UreF n=1 Tax=Catenulispora acidiphila (strain DSM 44928 / JCM 14897 / NBRC 102108 / NRRL B-24433 / ID139908) TaxID=479433 RepID=C7PWL4_CATAD|nr:urease accessory UreF family protein [Catenulispora acidiphila]ACU75294.1 putative urease accessory protein [Catenulispora acidiphila DSM 44928]
MNLASLLMLTDSRLPAGTHAHSGGLEAAVAAGRVLEPGDLHAFLLGRLTTTGLTGAAFSAAALEAARGPDDALLAELDAEYEARTPSPAQRRASRTLGRQLLRAVRAGWPGPALAAASAVHPDGPHQPIAFGAAGVTAGLSAHDAALACALGAVSGPANAATRLLGVDPDAVTRVLAVLEPHIQDTADAALKAALGPISELPSFSAPRLDISAEHHSTWEVRLFAS